MTSPESIPAPLDDEIFSVFGRPTEEQAAGFDELCARWPDFAQHIRARQANVAKAASDTTSVERLGRFEIIGELGVGGMGKVHLAFDPNLGREVALKEMWPHLLADTEQRHRFERERKALAMLKHPNLCRILETGDVDGSPFLVMELINGRPLDRELSEARENQRRPSTTQEVFAALETIEQAARGLDHAHDAGLVHRDIKPGNIMITHDGEPVVLDFGLVLDERNRGETRSGYEPGTPEYQSPEQVRATSGKPDRRTDVWSLAIVLYELLTLRRPFTGNDRHALQKAIVEREQTPVHRINPSVPRDVSIVIAKALEKQPERRYQTAALFADELRRIHRREPILARPAGPLLRFRRWAQRNRVAAVFLFLMTVGFAATAALYVVAEKSARAATRSSNRAKRIAAQARFEQGEFALSRGAWTQAIRQLEAAVAGGHPRTPRLVLGLVDAYEGSMQPERAVAELDSIADRANEAEYGARIRLKLADLNANRLRDPDSGLAEIQQVLDSGQLGEDDAAYAEALQAKTIAAVRQRLEICLRENPRHRRANELLAVTMISQSAYAEAREFGSRLKVLFPEDPLPLIVLATAAGLDDDKDGFARWRDALHRHPLDVATQAATTIEQVVQLRDRLRDVVQKTAPETRGKSTVAVISLLTKELPIMRAAVQLVDGPTALVRFPPVLARVVHEIIDLGALIVAESGKKVFGLFGKNPIKTIGPKMVATLDRCYEMVPDGVFALLRGHLHRSVWKMDKIQAAQDYRRAYQSPSMLNLRRHAMWLAQTAEVHLAAFEKNLPDDQKAAFRRAAIETCQLYMAEAGMNRGAYGYFTNAFQTLDEMEESLRIATEYRRTHPDDLQPLLFQASTAKAMNAPALSLRYAREALARDPNDGMAKRFETDAENKLAEIAKSRK